MQNTTVIRQNELLKSYVSRLQKQLDEYIGTHLPPPTATTPGEGEIVDKWIGDGGHILPLFVAYDQRIAELKEGNDQMARELDLARGRIQNMSVENERLSAEATRLLEQACARLQDQIGSAGVGAIGVGTTTAQNTHGRLEVGVLTNENELLTEENRLLRADLDRARRDLAEQARR
eukprot:CAMPEP_0113723006 /NCGR_PEP_ID=MMETSP0038_2-20120614/38125_1 /TAXON_ID=2898 /ORGANISM="Cryptomonas paramecium" /LENGTH=175 /DNA_ID=CAMNT_0000652431 /DNA_START=35 /DNA_END=558 /DNA_ORIENTATION=+ /assembly_acc=CAM_ASM_000170